MSNAGGSLSVRTIDETVSIVEVQGVMPERVARLVGRSSVLLAALVD